MGRHGTGNRPSHDPSQQRLTRPPGSPTAAHARFSSVTTGRILVAAVAAGAVLPALQTLDTHVADADAATSGSMSQADLALASQHQAAARPAARPGGVAAVAMPAASAPRPSRTSSGHAGDASDVASLTKAMGVARENGPMDFGRPYSAGDDDSLDGQIAKALGLLGLPQKLSSGVKKIIMHESTGNADAVNNTDSNAAAGTPSKGLMQLIDTTFRNAVLPSEAAKGIFDPVANITAGVRTMIANHGMDAVMDGGLRNSSGGYIGYGGAKLPSDGLGLASRS